MIPMEKMRIIPNASIDRKHTTTERRPSLETLKCFFFVEIPSQDIIIIIAVSTNNNNNRNIDSEKGRRAHTGKGSFC